MWTCKNCGSNNSDNANFCTQCGKARSTERPGSSQTGSGQTGTAANSSGLWKLLIVAAFVALLGLVLYLAVGKVPAAESAGAAKPHSVTGESSGSSAAESNSTYNSLSSARVGSVITFGRYEQNGDYGDGDEDIEWIVLAKENGRILVISRYILERIVYDSQGGYYSPAWDDSAVCPWLNEEFLYSAFTASERSRIDTVTVTNDVRDVHNKVFLLSAPEAWEYFSSDYQRRSTCTPLIYENDSWFPFRTWEEEEYDELTDSGRNAWLLRAEGYFSDCAAYVDETGEICEAYGNGLGEYINGVRPAMWIIL